MMLGYNAPCHCGSQNKYKYCCFGKDESVSAFGQGTDWDCDFDNGESGRDWAEVARLETLDENAEARVAPKLSHIQLTGLYYCLTGNAPVLAEITDKADETLPKSANSIRQLSTRPVLSREELGTSIIPYVLLNQNTGWFFQSREIDPLRNILQYRFSDDLILSGNEILRHPYARILPLDLLPVQPVLTRMPSKMPGGEVPRAHYFLAPLSMIGCPTSEREDLEAAYLRVLLAAEKAKIPIYLILDRGREGEDRPAFLLKGIQTLNARSLECHARLSLTSEDESGDEVTQLDASLSWKDLRANIGWGSYFGIDVESRILYLHRSQAVMARLMPYTTDAFQIQVSGHQEITNCLEILRELDREAELTFHFEALRREINNGAFTSHIFIESSGGFYVAHSAKDGKGDRHVFWNLPQSGSTLCDLLQGGLGSITDGGSHSVAKRRSGSERNHDLWILRHLGAAALTLIEIASLLEIADLSSEPVSKKQVEERKDVLLKKFHAMVSAKEGSAFSEDSSPFSRNIPPFIREVLSGICTKEGVQDTIYVPGEEWQINTTTFTAQLIRSVIEQLADETKGKVFMRPKSADLQILAEWVSDEYVQNQSLTLRPAEAKRYTHPNRSTSQWVAAFLPLEKNGAEIYLDGQRLDYLDPAELTTNFELLEHENQDSSKIDWFELNPKVFFKGKELSKEEAQELSKTGILKHQGRWYQLCDRSVPSVEALDHFWSRIARSRSKSKGGGEVSTYLRLPRHQILELLALRQKGLTVSGGPRWKEICDFYDALGKSRSIDSTLSNGALKPFQIEGVQWLYDLYRLGLGGILADDMGLGKTIQTLCFLDALRKKGELGRVLIVVPTSLVHSWLSEARRFTPDLEISFEHPKLKREESTEKPAPGVLLTTYGLLAEHEDLYTRGIWNVVVFDEAQNLKNISAQRTTCARKLKANFKCCLTGTPMENHLGEFFSLIDLVVPGALGDLAHFRNTFVNKLSALPKEVEFLKLKTRPLVLRRHKAQILKELPEKTESELRMPFSKRQKEIYRNIAISWNDKVQESLRLKGEARSRLVMLTALLRLRQVCSYPKIVPGIRYSEEAPKITMLKEMVSQILESGESVLVFTQFLGTQEKLYEDLIKIHPERIRMINGATSLKDRGKILDSFNNSSQGGALLMTLKTGGVGLNLTKASYVFHVEPWWNPAVENQASDRVHRMGQVKKVQIYRMIMEQSIEEKIEILKRKKQDCFSSVFGMEENVIAAAGESRLTAQDFQYLVS